MNNLNINNFMNEMSYDLTMEELERIVVDYQEVIIRFVSDSQYNYKMKDDFNNVCSIIRSDKYFDTLAALINSEDKRIMFDMAYILYTATHFPNDDIDDDLKFRAIQLAMKLRTIEMDDELTDNDNVNTAIILSSIKALRDYSVQPFVRAKEVENILETMPEILYHAFNEKYMANNIYDNLLEYIIRKAVKEVKPEEILTALCKLDFDRDKMDKKYVPYASRIQMYAFKLAGKLEKDKFNKAIDVACKSISRFNNRTGMKVTLGDKYLNFALMKAIVQSQDTRVPDEVKTAYFRLLAYKEGHKMYEELF